jgi:AraC-like DNA-binding protein
LLQPVFEVRRYRGDVITHSHDFHQVVLPLEGQLRMVVAGVEGTVSSDCVALVAAGASHSFTGSKSNSFLVIEIPTRAGIATDALGVLLWERARHHPFVPVEAELLQLIRYLARATECGQLREPLVSHACALLLGTVATQLGFGKQGAWPSSLRVVAGYVDAHLEWPLTVADMARVGNVSASRLHALFREHLVTTPQKYLTQRRLNRASELLAHTSLSVTEVALRVGYGDQAAFTRAFRKHMGRAPLGYRAAASTQQAEHKSQ